MKDLSDIQCEINVEFIFMIHKLSVSNLLWVDFIDNFATLHPLRLSCMFEQRPDTGCGLFLVKLFAYYL